MLKSCIIQFNFEVKIQYSSFIFGKLLQIIFALFKLYSSTGQNLRKSCDWPSKCIQLDIWTLLITFKPSPANRFCQFIFQVELCNLVHSSKFCLGQMFWIVLDNLAYRQGRDLFYASKRSCSATAQRLSVKVFNQSVILCITHISRQHQYNFF